MKRVIRFETADGQLHLTLDAAQRHAEVRYGERLTATAHAMVKLEKYSAMCAFLDGNLAVFENLLRLKADCEPPRDEGNDE
jgi:hypothetical protein